MRRFLIVSLLLGSAVPLTALAQALPGMPVSTPALQVTRPIYAWKTEHDTNKKTGVFNHCLVKNMYDNGTVLMLAENNEGVKRLALNFPQPKMTANDHFDLTAQVDKRDVFPVEAVAVSSQILTIGIPEALPDQMRKGQALYLRGPNDEVVYTLDGMEGAVTALQDCVMTQKGGQTKLQTADAGQPIPPQQELSLATPSVKTESPSETPPVAASNEMSPIAKTSETEIPETAKEQPMKPTIVANAAAVTATKPSVTQESTLQKISRSLEGEKKIEVMEEGPPPSSLPASLHTIFNAAGLQPTAFITTPEKNKESKRPLDYAWIKGDTFIGVKEQSPVPHAGLEQATMYYLRLLKARCNGTFIAESGTIATVKTLQYLPVEAACSPGTKDDTIAALLFANDAQHLRVYFIESSAAKGAEAIKGRDAILNVLKKQ